MSEISKILGISIPKLTKEFDQIDVAEGLQYEFDGNPINLLIDATFFGRDYGYLCFHDCSRIIYFKEIKTESVRNLREGLNVLKEAKYIIRSITIDGRRGYYNNIRRIFGNIPIQMCIFHQKAIIRRYITDNPQSNCGQELKELCTRLTDVNTHQKFIDDFYKLKDKYRYILAKRNVDGNYKHQSLRSAFRSLDANMMHIFLYTDSKSLEIPPTINHLEGLFSHLKERINIHRGLRLERKKKAIKFLLKNLGQKSKK
ncbi:MAG: hypothetical protein ISQ34_01230 [Rickettsiales bacterium]|nr:hypothetical protein [Rickettsiales bacterium]